MTQSTGEVIKQGKTKSKKVKERPSEAFDSLEKALKKIKWKNGNADCNFIFASNKFRHGVRLLPALRSMNPVTGLSEVSRPAAEVIWSAAAW